MRPGFPASPSPSQGNRETLAPFSLPTNPMPPHRLRRSHRLRGQDPGEECSRSSCGEDKEHEAKPASAQPQTEVPVSCVWERRWREWGRQFFVRLDLQGSFHTYPNVGGPFQSLKETYGAIDRYLEASRDPKMCVEQDKAIMQCLYWPDGTIKRHANSSITKKSEMRQMVEALVDKYNEDNKLFEDHAHELKDVLRYHFIAEKRDYYYHFNFTTKIKGGGPKECSMDNLFFVEVKCMLQGVFKELQVNCFCPVNLNDNGQCYGCTKYGDVDMKHPSSDSYTAGHLNLGLPFGYLAMKKAYEEEDEVDDDKYVKAREAELRKLLCLHRLDVTKKLCTRPSRAKGKAPK